MLHGYCVRRAGEPAPATGLTGVDSAPVAYIEKGLLGLWYSAGGGRPTVDRLREHDRVVRAALRSATPLPLRYGAVFADEAAIEVVLVERASEFSGTLERIGQRVEMAVQVARPPPPSPADSIGAAPLPPAEPSGPEVPDPSPTGGTGGETPSGRGYLEARRRVFEAESRGRSEADALLDEIAAELADLELPTVRSIVLRGGVIASMAHLLHRDRVVDYRRRVADLQRRRPDLLITAIGPWAPYSFV